MTRNQDVDAHFSGLIVERFLICPGNDLVTVKQSDFGVSKLHNLKYDELIKILFIQ
jgi:hypothetical protein